MAVLLGYIDSSNYLLVNKYMNVYNFVKHKLFLKEMFAFSQCSTSNYVLWIISRPHPHLQSASLFVQLIDILSNVHMSNNMEQYLALGRALH
jgi:hypothetical protein